jgi:hypothetical protein
VLLLCNSSSLAVAQPLWPHYWSMLTYFTYYSLALC